MQLVDNLLAIKRAFNFVVDLVPIRWRLASNSV